MTAVTLVEMTDEEFARRREPMIREYGQDLARSGGMTVEQAETQAEQQTDAILPEGARSTGQLLRTAWVDGQEVGWIWVSLPGHAMPGMAWVDDIQVDDEHRRHGYGQGILEAMEAELVTLGVRRLGLNVFGGNDVAQRLYERLGFRVIQQQRSRSLAEVPGGATVTLQPITADEFDGWMESYVASTLADYPTLSPAEAHDRAWKPLPQGFKTEHVQICAIVADGTEVGRVCYTDRHWNRTEMGWVYRLDIDEPLRGRGLGTATVAAVEADVAGRGVASIGVGLPGSLDLGGPAERLGFAVIAQQMEKNL
jgi:mycothiol synthase